MRCFDIGLGAKILSMEIIKRSLNPKNRGRDGLIKQALECKLIQALLGVLDWKSDDPSKKGVTANNADEGTLRVLIVDIIHLLRREGSQYTEVVRDMVDE